MAITGNINIKESLQDDLNGFFRSVLDLEEISALLIPMRVPGKEMVMPTLVSDPEALDNADPLAPAFPYNGAKALSKLTRKPIGGKIAAFLRPCEIRAFFELVKLKQGSVEEIIIIGADCFGAYTNNDYKAFFEENPEKSTSLFLDKVISGKDGGPEISEACKACEFPIPYTADIAIGLLGLDIKKSFLVQGQTEKGRELLEKLPLDLSDPPCEREKMIPDMIEKRKKYRDNMIKRTKEATDTLEKLTAYLSNCINCYNCRVACPVCYCKECVFITDVFNHEPSLYLKWAKRKGIVKMPTDTTFYHITRLAHMSTACVGCGQCSNACPNDIHVMELFRMVAGKTQEAFGYEAGRSLDEMPPLSFFKEDEFPEVVGIN